MTDGIAPARARFLRRDLDRSSVALVALAGVAIIAFLVLPTGSVGQAVVFLGSNAGAVLLLARAWMQGHLRSTGRRLLVAGAVVYLVGDVVWSGAGFGLLPALPYPSPADALLLASYWLFGGFLLAEILARPSDRSSAIGVTLDAAIVGAAGAIIIVHALIEPVLGTLEGADPWAVATSMVARSSASNWRLCRSPAAVSVVSIAAPLPAAHYTTGGSLQAGRPRLRCLRSTAQPRSAPSISISS